MASKAFTDSDLLERDSNEFLASTIPYISSHVRETRSTLSSESRTVERGKYAVLVSTAPLPSIIGLGPPGRNPVCICPRGCEHISFHDAMKLEGDFRDEIGDFCSDRVSFLVGRLPVWSTNLRNKVEFVDIPTVYHLWTFFRRATYWWKRFNGNKKLKFELGREARLLLMSSTGRSLKDFKFTSTHELLSLKTNRAAMGRLRNWFITLDGLQMSLLLASQGHPEICNWGFVDKVTQTYLNNALGDLFKISATDETYYADLKKYRNLMKDKILKERRLLEPLGNERFFPDGFWFFDLIVNVLNLNKYLLSPAQLKTIAYLTQTRSCGLPPKPVSEKAIEKFLKTVSSMPTPLSRATAYEVSRALDSVILKMKSVKNFEGLMNRANLNTKISLSNSASFFCPREVGGKVEDARQILENLPENNPYFNLDTGKIEYYFNRDDKSLTPGEKLLHRCIFIALTDLSSATTINLPHIGDVRISVVEEPGKARVITVSRVEHSIILHALAHFLSIFISVLPSSRTGMKASQHMWDTLKRIKKENLSRDGMYTGTTSFFGSEDWESATDALNPFPIRILFDGLMHGLELPKFYTRLCRDLLTMPRRVYDKTILETSNYQAPLTVKFSGIFQGDPCCKQMLHMTHLVSREAALNNMKVIGRKTITPLAKKDKAGNQFGHIPNIKIIRSRFSSEFLHEELLRHIRPKPVMDEGNEFGMRLELLSQLRNPQVPSIA